MVKLVGFFFCCVLCILYHKAQLLENILTHLLCLLLSFTSDLTLSYIHFDISVTWSQGGEKYPT
jgi:hypothetical protein